MLVVFCERWINEAAGTQCQRIEGHTGPCATNEQIARLVRRFANLKSNYRAGDLRNMRKEPTDER